MASEGDDVQTPDGPGQVNLVWHDKDENVKYVTVVLDDGDVETYLENEVY